MTSPGPDRDPAPAPDPDAPRWSRRDLLRRVGATGAVAFAGGVLAHDLIPHRHPWDPVPGAGGVAAGYHGEHAAGGALAPALISSTSGSSSGLYGHAAMAPTRLTQRDLDTHTYPPPPDGRPVGTLREVDLTVTTRQLEVGDGVVVDAWTYAGGVPGPVLRATEGDRLRIAMANRSPHPHNVHLHGRHDPAMDGWEPIPPGESFTYEVVAEPFGLHPYHCHTAPIAEHLGRGLYGAMIVDPPGGRPAAHEVVLVLGGWDLDGDGRNELVCFNGIAGGYHRFPITVPVGELVRVYVVNMLEHDPVASFHLHAQTFDVYRSGTSLTPDEHTDVVALTQGERAILEFRLPQRGRYMFHPHQTRLADRGAMGWFAAV